MEKKVNIILLLVVISTVLIAVSTLTSVKQVAKLKGVPSEAYTGIPYISKQLACAMAEGDLRSSCDISQYNPTGSSWCDTTQRLIAAQC